MSKNRSQKTEREIEILKTEQKRLMIYLMIPGVVLFAFVMMSNSPSFAKAIAPLPVGAAMILVCILDIAIATPFVLKLNKIKQRLNELTQ